MPFDLTGILASALPAAVTGLWSYLAARRAAKKDIDALKLQWKHERELDIDAQLSALLRAVTDFCHNDLGYDENILADIMAFRAVAPVEWDYQLDLLYNAVAAEDRPSAEAHAKGLVHIRQDRKP